MRIDDSHELQRLFRNLLRMLEHLNFSEIRTKSRSNNSVSGTDKSNRFSLDYTPDVLAIKNDVKYLFEYVRDCDDISNLQDTLQSHTNGKEKKSDVSLVLVTEYGNKEHVRQTAEDLCLPFDQIWEI